MLLQLMNPHLPLTYLLRMFGHEDEVRASRGLHRSSTTTVPKNTDRRPHGRTASRFGQPVRTGPPTTAPPRSRGPLPPENIRTPCDSNRKNVQGGQAGRRCACAPRPVPVTSSPVARSSRPFEPSCRMMCRG